MTSAYIYLNKKWPGFTWDQNQLTPLLERVRLKQGRLIGKMEGEKLDRAQVRSSIARRMGMDVAGLVRSDRDIEGVVEMMMDATQNYKQALSSKRLFDWHAALFPTGRSGMTKITVGNWRNDSAGPMQVVSGSVGREKIHFEAPVPQKYLWASSGTSSFFQGSSLLNLPKLTVGIWRHMCNHTVYGVNGCKWDSVVLQLQFFEPVF